MFVKALCDMITREVINPAYRKYRNMRATPMILMAELGLAQLHFSEKTPVLGDLTAPESLFRSGELDPSSVGNTVR